MELCVYFYVKCRFFMNVEMSTTYFAKLHLQDVVPSRSDA